MKARFLAILSLFIVLTLSTVPAHAGGGSEVGYFYPPTISLTGPSQYVVPAGSVISIPINIAMRSTVDYANNAPVALYCDYSSNFGLPNQGASSLVPLTSMTNTYSPGITEVKLAGKGSDVDSLMNFTVQLAISTPKAPHLIQGTITCWLDYFDGGTTGETSHVSKSITITPPDWLG